MAPWLGGVAHVFVADLGRPRLSEDDQHHLSRVLRLRPGEEVTASDGAGRWRRCRLLAGGGLEPVSEVAGSPSPVPAVTVGFALTKGDRPEWTVQKLVEVGVDRIVPLVTARTVVRWDPDKAGRQADRLRAVARGAAMQSRRVWFPVVADLSTVESLAALGAPTGGVGGQGAASDGAGVAVAQIGGQPAELRWPTVVVGPEGGWDESELAHGLPQVSLGPLVLRAETAAMAAGVLLCGLRAGVIRSAGAAGAREAGQ